MHRSFSFSPLKIKQITRSSSPLSLSRETNEIMKAYLTLLALFLGLFVVNGQQVGYLEITEDDWKIVQTAAEIASGGFGRRGLIDRVFQRNGKAGVVRTEGRCYVAFRGPRLASLQLFLPRRTNDYCVENECCLVQRKWQREIRDLVSDIKPDLEACVNDYCTEMDCTVITGHGTGASLASLAAMSLKAFNPFTITFGEIQNVETPCALVDSDRYWRIINTEQVDGALVYDRLSARRYDRFPKALGHILLLSSVDSTAVAHMGIDRNWEYNPSEVRILPGRRTDSMSKYQDRISAITAKYTTTLSYPVAPDGFDGGALCTFGGECQSRLCGETDGKRVCLA